MYGTKFERSLCLTNVTNTALPWNAVHTCMILGKAIDRSSITSYVQHEVYPLTKHCPLNLTVTHRLLQTSVVICKDDIERRNILMFK